MGFAHCWRLLGALQIDLLLGKNTLVHEQCPITQLQQKWKSLKFKRDHPVIGSETMFPIQFDEIWWKRTLVLYNMCRNCWWMDRQFISSFGRIKLKGHEIIKHETLTIHNYYKNNHNRTSLGNHYGLQQWMHPNHQYDQQAWKGHVQKYKDKNILKVQRQNCQKNK